jgi:hypothetical protein
MKTTIPLISCLTVVLFLGCSSVTMKYDYDPEYDFGQFKTYRWASGKEMNPDDKLAQTPWILKMVQAAVDKELQAKNLRKVENGDCNVVILAHAGTKERKEITQTGPGHDSVYKGWYDPWWGPYGGTTQVSYYNEATLVIDIISWENRELAWRGMATGIVRENNNPESTQKLVNEVVSGIFSNYPPEDSSR